MGLPNISLIIGFLLSFLMAIAMGGNDAASPTATAVGARAIGIKQALVLFAIFSAMGAMTQGFMVMKTIGMGIVPSIDLLGAIIAVLSAFTWIMICNVFGLEISVTHSIIGSILGYGIAAYSISGIQWDLLQTILISWFISPLFAALLAFFIYKLLAFVVMRYIAIDKLMSPLLKLTLCYSAYAFGTNDIANATGVYVTVARMALGNPPEQNVMFLLALFGSIGLAIGGFWLGPRVIEMVAFRITRLSLISGTAAETSNAVTVHLFTLIPYMIFGFGMPISTSLASIGALVGVGFASYGSSGINKKTILVLSAGWVATIFITASLTYVFYTMIFPYSGSIIKPGY